MDSALSIDLACFTKNLGICLLTASQDLWSAHFLRTSDLQITDPLQSRVFAHVVSDFCHKEGIRILLVDGPQAWKDPDSELLHCRACERELATPAKTGTVGSVKPKTWVRFVSFSIGVFESLVTECGAQLAESHQIIAPKSGFLALESFPTSAWRALKLKPLPGKTKSKPFDIADRVASLRQYYKLELSSEPSHDELQALVSALAGPAILNGNSSGYCAHGTAPVIKNGVRVEGYIVNPRCLPTMNI
jgi:hypothetical protein